MLRAVCLLIIVFFLWVPASPAQVVSQPDKKVLVACCPPLQQNTVDDLARFLEWIFQTRLADAQKRVFQEALVDAWTRGDRREIDFWTEVLRARLGAGNISTPRSAVFHEDMSRAMLGDLKKYLKRGDELGKLFASVTRFAAQASGASGGPATADASAGRAAGGYAGTFIASGGGNTVTLKLDQDVSGRVTGELSSTSGARFGIEGSLNNKGNVIGVSRGPQGLGYFLAELSGQTLTLTIADTLPNGQANMAAARRVQFQRADGGASPGGFAQSPQAPARPDAGDGAMGAASPQDQQMAQLLLSSAGCSFTYSGTAGTSSGTSRTERVVFRADGNGLLRSGSESYYSNPYGTAAGQRSGGEAFRWQVRGGMLHLSFNGGPWAPTPLQISQNSNGYPIVKASAKEYSMCN